MDTEKFNELLEKIQALNAGVSLFFWDNLTGGSKGGLRTRIKSLSILASESFKLSISEEMKGFIDELSANEALLDDVTRAKLRICRKTYNNRKNIPVEEAKAFDEHTALAAEAWETAKSNNDFASFAPFLAKNIEFVKKFAHYRNPESENIYNILLDDYEPGLTTKKLDEFFASLRARIVPLLKKVMSSDKKIDRLGYPIPLEQQKKIGEFFLKTAGFDMDRGNIGETEHPFQMSLSKYDSRIATHYYEDMFFSSMFSLLHEAGHAIYEQNKRDDIAETMLDDGISMAIHESQSRFYENIVGRSKEFWLYAWPKIKEMCGPCYEHVTAGDIYEAVNIAEPSLIRTEADELTYALHVMVRYEMEKLIFSQNIDVYDLPELWNSKYNEYLGITPSSDTNGILQDVHWSEGMFGYFPSYAIGSAYSAQLLHYMQKDIDVFGSIEKGDISPVTEWLKEKIHQYGSIYEPGKLIKDIAGEELNAEYYVDYLEKKFTEIYGLQ